MELFKHSQINVTVLSAAARLGAAPPPANIPATPSAVAGRYDAAFFFSGARGAPAPPRAAVATAAALAANIACLIGDSS